MNKRRFYASMGWVAMATAVFFCACRPELPKNEEQIPEGMCKVVFRLPKAYPDIPALANQAKASNIYDNKEALPLPEGSTLWLIYEEYVGNAWQPCDTAKPYVVMNDADGTRSVYPCQVDREGNAIPGSIQPSLYLKPGTSYRFRAVSPAKAWDDKDNFGYLVDNGQTLLANDERYNRTRPLVHNLVGGAGDIEVIELNPLAYQTAKVQFTVCPAEGIHQLGLLPSGIEITGCQDIVDSYSGHNWSAMGDTIVAYPGHKRSSVSVKECSYVQKDTTINDGGTSFVLPEGSLIAETTLLPTDARSNSIVVSFNIQINGIPTHYSLYLNNKVFRAGRSYHYIGRVSIEDGITVFSWQNVQWNTDVEI